MLECITYKSVNDLLFGTNLDEVISFWGQPYSTSKNREGCVELTYNDFRVIFDEEGYFSELGVLPKTRLTLNGEKVGWTWKDVEKFILMDSDPKMDDVGFIILYDLGMAVVDFHTSDDDDFNDKALIFFKKGVYDCFKDEMLSINLDDLKKQMKENGLNICMN